MKRILHFRMVVAILLATMGITFAHEQITLDPSQLIPDTDSGYYVNGAWVDDNKDGVDEWYNGCFDAYGDRHHFEWGTQQEFTYNDCMIMPTCASKDTPTVVSTGYIELTKSESYASSIAPGTEVDWDTVSFGWIISPSFMNLDSIHLETSNDVTCNDSRHIYFYLDFSADGGQTWESTFIQDETCSKKGDLFFYDVNKRAEFKEFVNKSKEVPIVIRLSSGQQRVKVHKWIITAEASNAVKPLINQKSTFEIKNNTIISLDGELTVFNIMGQFIENGREVSLRPGIYLVKNDKGLTSKVIIK